MDNRHSIQNRLLADVASFTHSVGAARASRLQTSLKNVYTGMWELRVKNWLDGQNTITDAGRQQLAKLAAADSGTTTQNPATARPKKRVSNANTAPKPAGALVSSAQAPPQSRSEAAKRVADSVIANARNSSRALRTYLDETVEMTPLLASLLTSLDGSLTLIEQTYQAAAG